MKCLFGNGKVLRVFFILSRCCFSNFVYGNDSKFQWQFLFLYNIAKPFPYLINRIFLASLSVLLSFENEIKKENIHKTGQHSR